ncbi:MAG: class I SAM-dependent methyltransferase [Elusimicrobia bacterium]|nr:class I SAM-dependent methyltransferase [Elusimicrobiota bacterium]
MQRPGCLPEDHRKDLECLADVYWWHIHRRKVVLWLVNRFLSAHQGHRYLDVGCGPGATTHLIAEELSRSGLLDLDSPGSVAGMDVDPELKEPCEKYGVAFELVDLDQEDSLGGGDGFSLFTLLDVLEHLKNPQALLSGLRSKLAPGALGIVTVPAFEQLYSSWDVGLGHHRRYTMSGLVSILQQGGYEVLYSSYLYGFAFFPAYLVRRLGKRQKQPPLQGLEFPRVPSWMNILMGWICAAERKYLRWGRLPLGTSVVAAVRKKG